MTRSLPASPRSAPTSAGWPRASCAAWPTSRTSGSWGIADEDRLDERTPTFAIRVGDQDPLKTATELARRGIYVWDGHYYAITVMERLGLLDTGGAVRIGFCHYHSMGDVDRVLEALADLA